jgi:hypothetical protein
MIMDGSFWGGGGGKVPTLLLPKSNNWPTLVFTSDYTSNVLLKLFLHLMYKHGISDIV